MSSTLPATKAVAVDISATDHTFEAECRGIYVGGAGNLIVKLKDAPSTSITLTGVLAGQIYAIQAKAVVRSGTTATNMVALF